MCNSRKEGLARRSGLSVLQSFFSMCLRWSIGLAFRNSIEERASTIYLCGLCGPSLTKGSLVLELWVNRTSEVTFVEQSRSCERSNPSNKRGITRNVTRGPHNTSSKSKIRNSEIIYNAITCYSSVYLYAINIQRRSSQPVPQVLAN